MNNKRIKVTLYNRTYKEIDMSDFTCLPEELFANRDDIVEVVLPEGYKQQCFWELPEVGESRISIDTWKNWKWSIS